jgi:heavy metal sensor kinase
MIFKTFRLRLTIIYTAIVVLLFLAFAFVTHSEYRKELMETIDKDLLKTAKTESPDESNPGLMNRNTEIIKKVGNEYYQITSQSGKVIITLINKTQQLFLNWDLMVTAFKGAPQFETIQYKGEKQRALYFPVKEDTILHIRKSLVDTEESLVRIKKLFLIFLPVILMVSSLIFWLLAGKLLDPVIKIRLLAEKIRHGKLGERINIGFKGKEIDDLVTIFNTMLDSIQHSMESQKRFSSDVSHEIRSPLTSLRGSIEVALRKKRNPEEYEDILRNNLSDIIRLSKITDNLLFLTRADNNILELRRQWFDVKRFMETMIDNFRYKILSAGISITEDYQANLELNGDIDLLEHAFSNIIDNAVKYTPAGGKITVITRKEDGNIVITISDTGIGISEDNIPHIFERFYRVDRDSSRKLSGTGLGLAITKWIIHAHNGKISVKSTLGSGSEFIVAFPETSD